VQDTGVILASQKVAGCFFSRDGAPSASAADVILAGSSGGKPLLIHRIDGTNTTMNSGAYKLI